MAQTIAVRSGAVSCNWSNSNTNSPFQTLFTQSGGSARVILNSFELGNNGSGGSGAIALYIYSSGTGIRTPICMLALNTGWSNLAVLPGNTNGPSGTFYALKGSDGQTLMENNYPTGITYVGGFAQIPANFWMGNGDSLLIRGYWGSASGMCYYNFTTITES